MASLKKKMAALICGALMAFSSMAFATVRADQVMLGDLQPGMKLSQVKEIYGEPLQRVDNKLIYKGFYIELSTKHSNIVEEITTEDSGFATQDGVIVGMSENILNDKVTNYGKADKLEINGNTREYEYYSSDYKYKMEFKVVNGIITKISCELR